MKTRYLLLTAIFAALCAPLAAKEPTETKPSAFLKTTLAPDLITMAPTGVFARFDLTLRGPDGFFQSESFSGFDIPFIEIFDSQGNFLADGQYFYEVTAAPVIEQEVREAMAAARASGDQEAIRDLRAKGLIPREGLRQSGTFRIQNGAILLPDQAEVEFAGPLEAASEGRPDGARPGTPEGGEDPGIAPEGDGSEDARRDIVYIDDVIVGASLCVGFSCVNNEVFGNDTIRLKETTLRIKFQDTSVGSYPSGDWQLTPNDSALGGANRFSIDDIDNNRTPFTLEAGARTHALYVDDNGRVGLGTSTPADDLHIVTGDTPALRLQQDASGGFAAQTWEVAGNEAGFFVEDSSIATLPFRILPGAPNTALVVDSQGEIGLGILNAQAGFHMRDILTARDLLMDGFDPSLRVERTNGTVNHSAIQLDLVNNGQVNLRYNNNAGGINRRWNTGVDPSNRYFISAAGTGAFEFLLQTNGNLTLTGTVTAPSDVNMKQDFEPVSPEDVLTKVLALPLSTWSYTHDQSRERHMGPMAQDFYAAFGLGQDERHISFTDTAGVAFGAIQGMAKVIESKDARIATLEAQLADQEARLRKLEALLLEK